MYSHKCQLCCHFYLKSGRSWVYFFSVYLETRSTFHFAFYTDPFTKHFEKTLEDDFVESLNETEWEKVDLKVPYIAG